MEIVSYATGHVHQRANMHVRGWRRKRGGGGGEEETKDTYSPPLPTYKQTDRDRQRQRNSDRLTVYTPTEKDKETVTG